ncbi:ATP synthase F1 subunit gamma [Intestinimonas massiliensis (ex Afouda et al. 2020)]|uniref:ATP synthase F1 subunit gamma n=1 Tax=Intestinimonas massiliensis (ex Afouda et al. 2020) TaxID=1673721 RepID=UPI0010321DA4|nr:ATP synthase F1 subunit gamma [Intestinimonas massiliensis (ex Afouda et al. 2020)]
MASIKEIRTHIKSVEQTLKNTNAMYLISSSNLRKARKQLNDVEPYFQKIETTISDILHHSSKITHPFFDKRPEIPAEKRKVGYIVVTGDKGLAGAYNHNILKLAEEKLARTATPSLFVVGQVGRSYFQEHGIPIDVEFLYTAQNPTVARARDISELIIDLYLNRQLDEVYILFTKMVTSFQMEPTVHKLLPLDPDVFPEYEENRDKYNRDVTYVPSVKAVMDRLVPGYLKGDLFGALVESYCSEQNARMTAMKSSSDNARSMLQNLNLSYNRARQAAITQEITEVVGGAQAAL